MDFISNMDNNPSSSIDDSEETTTNENSSTSTLDETEHLCVEGEKQKNRQNKRKKTKVRFKIQERIGNHKSKLKEQIRQLSENRLTVKQIFGNYAKSSTLHGFRYTCMDTFPLRRFLWAVLMLIGSVYFFVKLKDGIIEFYSFPYSTKTTIPIVENLEFPAISFCPINQYNESKVMNSQLRKLYLQNRLPLYKNWSTPAYDITGEHLVKDTLFASFKIDELFVDCDYISQDTDNPNIGYRLCNPRNFSTYISSKGQVCYTLNSGKAGHPRMEIERAGINNGFMLVLDLHNDDAIKSYPYTGLEVIFHDPAEPPISATGFVITTGFQTHVVMSKTQTENLPPMFSTMCDKKSLKYHNVYNQKACLLELLTDHISERCECRDAFMPDNGFPYCSFKQVTTCVFPAKETFDEQKAIQNCPLDCVVTSYDSERTQTRFLHNPPFGFEPILIIKNAMKKNKNTSHLLELRKKMSVREFDRYIEQNIIKVIFYYKEMQMILNKHSATFTFYNFLGGTGGAFQLMLGASLLTFVEFIDLLTILVYNQFLRLHKKWEDDEEHDIDLENNITEGKNEMDESQDTEE